MPYIGGMRTVVVLVVLGGALSSMGQISGGWQGQPRSSAPPALRGSQQEGSARGGSHPAPVRGPRRGAWTGVWGGGWWGGAGAAESRPKEEAKPAAKEDRLKELIISPTYEAPKVNPKMIEIP